MLEISWSELLILAVVTLLFVGPKELPVFLRTIGRYAGMMRRQANEFKSHFDAAMREAELAQMKEEMDKMQASVNAEVMSMDKVIKETGAMVPPELSQSSSFSAAAQAAVFPQSAGALASASASSVSTAAAASPAEAAPADPALPPPVEMGQVYVRPQAQPQPVVETAAAQDAPAAPDATEPPRPEVVKSES